MTELLNENRIALRALYQMQEAILPKSALRCSSRPSSELLDLARHKDVGYIFANELSLGDCEKMLLAFGTGVSYQSPNIESLGVLENGTGDLIESLKASLLMMPTGALSVRASRFASWARAAKSISCSSRSIISPKVQISSSVYRPAINKSVAYHKARWRLFILTHERSA